MKRSHSLCWLAGNVSFCCLFVTTPALAQIVPDTTLSNDSNVITQGNTKTINGGTRAGSNLFHSFEQFSVPENGVAYFNNAPDIQNIISRVTGLSDSKIDGLLQANDTANLFLLNPNGISFGSNAMLKIGGSFLASTASSLKFTDGEEFSTTNPQAAPLLTISTPIGLQFDRAARKIVNQSIALDDNNEYSIGLEVQPGKTLALVGGDVALEGGILTAPAGQIELGSVAGSGLVSLNVIDNGWTLEYEGVQNFGDIQLSQEAVVDASGEGGGNIQVHGGRITLDDESFIRAGTYSQNGQEIFIRASQLNIENFSFVATATFGSGKGGNITIETGKLLLLDGGQVVTGTFGEGPGGKLTVTASDSVELVDIAREADGEPITDEFDDPIPSGLRSQTFSQTKGAGIAGDLKITTQQLVVRDGAQISATTFGAGRAGDLTVQTSEIELVGAVLSANGELLKNENGLPFSSGLFAGTGIGSKGAGGNLTVITDQLSLRDKAVLQTSTLGTGNAGDMQVRASEFVELIGAVKDSPFLTGLLALSGGIPGIPILEATGKGGDIDLVVGTRQLLVQGDGAAITVSNLNRTSDAKGAGNITVTASAISLNNQGNITAETASGQGGNIDLQVQDLLLLQNNSPISTSAGIVGKGGDGGDITINTNNIVALENSDISANAFRGRGGQVFINAQGIFGIAAREEQNDATSDITATSNLGPQFSGTVQINTPDIDPSEALTNLPIEPANTEIAQDCQAGGGKGTSRFVSSGSGGLPTNPYEPLGSHDILADIQPPTRWVNNLADVVGTSTSPERTTSRIVEAQGWSTNKKGEVVLVAEVPHGLSQRGCRLH